MFVGELVKRKRFAYLIRCCSDLHVCRLFQVERKTGLTFLGCIACAVCFYFVYQMRLHKCVNPIQSEQTQNVKTAKNAPYIKSEYKSFGQWCVWKLLSMSTRKKKYQPNSPRMKMLKKNSIERFDFFLEFVAVNQHNEWLNINRNNI